MQAEQEGYHGTYIDYFGDPGVRAARELVKIPTEKAIETDGAEAIVLGCTGMMGLSQSLSTEMIKKNRPVPIIDPSGVAIGYLELLIRNQLVQSPLAYIQAIRKSS